MSILTAQLLNLLLNGTFSFFAGALIVLACVGLFRVENGRWKIGLLSLPFVKILWDIGVRQIPQTSILRSGFNPLDLPPKHQYLLAGAGLSEYGPIVNIVFESHGVDGKVYSTSIPDYFYFLLVKRIGPWLPSTLVAVVLILSMFFVARRIVTLWQFERRRQTLRRTDSPWASVSLRYRNVDVYSSSQFSGTPFTGGLLRPYVCFPQSSADLFSKEERCAVLMHEIAHVKHGDLFITLAVRFLGDLFWFVPGYGALSRKIDQLREMVADKVATKSGALAAHLASALIKMNELPDQTASPVLYSALFRERSLLRARVEALLGERPETGGRFGWNFRLLRIVIVLWTAGAVALATFGGNHDASHSQELSPRVKQVLKILGLTE